jgi:hypoxanthine phosphoribosyltransferase
MGGRGDRTVSSPGRQPTIVPLHTAEELQSRIAELARRLDTALPQAERSGAEEPLFLAILGGSLIFLADLVRALVRPVRFELVQVVSDDPADADEVKEIRYPIPVELADRDVVVVKDVVSSGVIESYLDQQLRGLGARSVRFAALIDLPEERKTGFEVEFRVLTAERQGLLVGYGLKHEGRYGNLPYIGRLEGA